MVGHGEQHVVTLAVHLDGFQSQQVVLKDDGVIQQSLFQRMDAVALWHLDSQVDVSHLEGWLFLSNHRIDKAIVDGVEFVAIVGRPAVDDKDHIKFGHYIDDLTAIASSKEGLGPRVLDGLGLVAVTQIITVDIVSREPRADGVPNAAQEPHNACLERRLGGG